MFAGICDPDGYYLNPDDMTCEKCVDGIPMTNTVLILAAGFAFVFVLGLAFCLCNKKEAIENSVKKAEKKMKAAEGKTKKSTPTRLMGLTDKLRKAHESMVVNKNGSMTFFKSIKSDSPPKTSTITEVKTMPYAKVATTTTTVEETHLVTSVKTTVAPSNVLQTVVSTTRSLQVKLKSITSFSQIAVNVAFNCQIE